MMTTVHAIAPAPTPAPTRARRIRLPWLFPGAGTLPSGKAGLADLHFVELDAIERMGLWFARKLGATTLVSPVVVRGQAPDAITPLPLLGQAMGFGDEDCQRLLRHHYDLQLRRKQIRSALGFFLLTLLMLLVYAPLLDQIPPPREVGYWTGSLLMGFCVTALAFCFLYIFAFVTSALTVRFTQVLVDRHFVESLCVIQSLYLLLELHRPDVLARAELRRELVARFDGLARAVRLLGLRYGSGEPDTRFRLHRHFRHIARYVDERRVWAVTPMATTLGDLRRDVWELARIFVMGTYGELKWAGESQEEVAAGWKPALRAAARAGGLLVPLTGLVYLLVNPRAMQALGGMADVIVLVLVAWALLALDALLQIGVVSGVVGLARSIKELK